MVFDWTVYFKIVRIWSETEMTWGMLPQMFGLVFIVSNLYSTQFGVAHEIMHKPEKINKIIATLHVVKLYYAHFTHHHLYNHHRNVATPLDPSTARKGENIYSFILNCIVNSWRGVYNEEKKEGKVWY